MESDSTSVKKDLRLLAARHLLDAAGSDELASEAANALMGGIDTPAIRRLAGMTGDDAEEVRIVFREVLRELEIETPSHREATIMLAVEVARRISAGTISPYDGAKEIWHLSVGEDVHELDTFAYAASEWQERPRQHKKWAAAIVAAANDLVRSRGRG